MAQHQLEPMRRYDIYARFADRHLRTRAERAVYLTLVSQEAQSWSPVEMARAQRLDERETERILEAYEASGIVERLEVPGGHRYRWRSDMNYLFGDVNDSPEWVDPVCGMLVTSESPYRVRDSFGRPRRFCSPLCLVIFSAMPGVLGGLPASAGEGA